MSSPGYASSDLIVIFGHICFIVLMATAALYDARSFRIPNVIPLALVALFSGSYAAGLYHPLAPHLVSLGIAFVAGCFLFYRGIWGGGDAKLLAALGLFAQPRDLVTLVLMTSIAGGVIAVFVLIEHKVRGQRAAHAAIPYGMALAAGGLNWCFTSG